MAGYRGNEASRKVIEETGRLYAELLSKPLDERQLARPTFRLIQEITKNLITETRTLRNVFNPSDFETENKTWDRRRKCEFIQRLIDFAANHKQPVVGCVADKLVAGLEPNKANELLQSLAKIAQARLAGQDGAPKRPRTFTRQSPNSVSPPNKHGEDRKDPSGGSRRVNTAHIADVKLAANKSAPRRSLQKTISKKVTPPARDGSASSSRAGSISHASAQPGNSTDPRLKVSGFTATDEGQNDNAERARRASSGISSNIEASGQTTPRSQPESKPTVKGQTITQQDVIVSESDINKNIQQLRTNLEQLRSNLLDVGQLETKLKKKLTEHIDYNPNELT